MRKMRRNPLHALAFGGLLLAGSAAQAASSLVYCSEGSPAGFDPGQYTTGTDYDATSEPCSTASCSSSAAAPKPSQPWRKAGKPPPTARPGPSTCARV